MEEKTKLALIYGSTRKGRFCDKVAKWAEKQIAAKGDFSVDVIDPAVPPVRAATEAFEAYDTEWLRHHIGQADAFLVVTPEYNHGYPGSLKSLIDSVGEEWHAKPVAFVSYGGVSGGLRAVEQLRQVFAELHAVTVRDSVSFANAWERFDDAGVLKKPERSEKQFDTLLRRLNWWSATLHHGRNAKPYKEA